MRGNIRRGNERFELYDLARDPREENDVAAAHPEIVARAARELAAGHENNPVFQMPALDR